MDLAGGVLVAIRTVTSLHRSCTRNSIADPFRKAWLTNQSASHGNSPEHFNLLPAGHGDSCPKLPIPAAGLPRFYAVLMLMNPAPRNQTDGKPGSLKLWLRSPAPFEMAVGVDGFHVPGLERTSARKFQEWEAGLQHRHAGWILTGR